MLSYLLSIYQSPTASAATVQWEIIRAFEPPKLPMGGYTFMSVLPSAKCIPFVRNISLSQSHKPFFLLASNIMFLFVLSSFMVMVVGGFEENKMTHIYFCWILQ